MNKMFLTIVAICSMLLLQLNFLCAQSEEKIKLTRLEKAMTYPTTFGAKYFVTPTAIPQEKGKFSVHNTELRMTSVNFGLSKNVSIGTGFNVFSILGNDYETSLPFITTKVGFQIAPNVHLGGGFFLVDDSDIELFGFGMFTLGDRNANITMAYIHDFSKEGLFDNIGSNALSPLSLSGMYRLNKHLAFVSENHFLGADNSIGTFMTLSGVRIILKKHAIDLGFIATKNETRGYYDSTNIYFELFPMFGYAFAL